MPRPPEGGTLLIVLGLLPPLVYWGVLRFFAPGKIKPEIVFAVMAPVALAIVLLGGLASVSRDWWALGTWTVVWILVYIRTLPQWQLHKRVLEVFGREANEGPAPMDVRSLHKLLCDLADAYPGKGAGVSFQLGSPYPCVYVHGCRVGPVNVGIGTVSELAAELVKLHPQAVRESPAGPLACMFERRPDGRVWLVSSN